MIALFALEISIAVALIIGFMYEDKIAAWEQKIIKKLKRKFETASAVRTGCRRALMMIGKKGKGTK